MKIDNDTRFPYPVLSDVTGDYKAGNFAVSAVVEEHPANGELRIDCTVDISEQIILQEVTSKAAMVGLFITCLDTYYNGLVEVPGMKSSIEFPRGTLKGRVSIRPLIWSTKDINGYSNVNLHDEYGGATWDFASGSVLAIGNELIVSVGHEKLAPMESIFSLAVNKDIPDGEIRVQPDSDKITIYCAQETFQMIASLRGTGTGRSILLNSIYLPAVMEVLSHLRDDEPGVVDKKWYRVFTAKCDHLNVDYSKGNFLEGAQRILKSPITKIKAIGESLT